MADILRLKEREKEIETEREKNSGQQTSLDISIFDNL